MEKGGEAILVVRQSAMQRVFQDPDLESQPTGSEETQGDDAHWALASRKIL